MTEFEEIECSGQALRIRKKRSLLGQSMIERVFNKDGTFGVHDVIKADCEIFDRETRQWKKLSDEDCDKLDGKESYEKIYKRIVELRKSEKDFQKTQQSEEKQTQENGS